MILRVKSIGVLLGWRLGTVCAKFEEIWWWFDGLTKVKGGVVNEFDRGNERGRRKEKGTDFKGVEGGRKGERGK